MDEQQQRARDEAMERLAITVAKNLQALMNAARDNLISGPIGVLALEATSGIGKSTIYRILSPAAKNDTSMGNLEALAACYGFEAWQLLRPGINPADPDEIAVALEVYRHIEGLAGRGKNANVPASVRPAQGAGGKRPTGSQDQGGGAQKKRPKADRP